MQSHQNRKTNAKQNFSLKKLDLSAAPWDSEFNKKFKIIPQNNENTLVTQMCQYKMGINFCKYFKKNSILYSQRIFDSNCESIMCAKFRGTKKMLFGKRFLDFCL